jgi:hypothetical protein
LLETADTRKPCGWNVSQCDDECAIVTDRCQRPIRRVSVAKKLCLLSVAEIRNIAMEIPPKKSFELFSVA